MFLLENSTHDNTLCLPSLQSVLLVLSLRGPLETMCVHVQCVGGCMCVLPRTSNTASRAISWHWRGCNDESERNSGRELKEGVKGSMKKPRWLDDADSFMWPPGSDAHIITVTQTKALDMIQSTCCFEMPFLFQSARVLMSVRVHKRETWILR